MSPFPVLLWIITLRPQSLRSIQRRVIWRNGPWCTAFHLSQKVTVLQIPNTYRWSLLLICATIKKNVIWVIIGQEVCLCVHLQRNVRVTACCRCILLRLDLFLNYAYLLPQLLVVQFKTEHLLIHFPKILKENHSLLFVNDVEIVLRFNHLPPL